jgi:hypothetical protein
MPGNPSDDEVIFEDELFEKLMTNFPHSRSMPPQTPGGFKDLGITPLAKQLGLLPEQTNGHWCSRCQGIWFGYTLETQCPACGNRNG